MVYIKPVPKDTSHEDTVVANVLFHLTKHLEKHPHAKVAAERALRDCYSAGEYNVQNQIVRALGLVEGV